jgi:steroid delta-isomerase-like uncharacterized protein
MSVEENKAVARRFVEAANRGDPVALKRVMADNFQARSLAGDMNFGPEAFSILTERVKSVPDFRSQIIDMIAEGDKVVVLGRDTGTPVAEYMGIPATGKSFDVTWVDVYRIVNGRIAEMIVEMNFDAMRRQIAG